MQLTTFETDFRSVHAGYACPCGCTPSVTYERGADHAIDRCCCGNEFAIGPEDEPSLTPRDGFEVETESRTAAWGEPVLATWLVGPSVHPERTDASGGHEHGHGKGGDDDTAMDPVCGMRVVPAAALEKGLHRQHEGVDYYFCGKGCYLEFGDDPGRFLDPSYVPSM